MDLDEIDLGSNVQNNKALNGSLPSNIGSLSSLSEMYTYLLGYW